MRPQDDDLLSVFSLLDAHDLWCFLCCCKRFYRLCSEDLLWRTLLTNELGAEHLPGSPPGNGGWRRRFWQWQRLESCMCTPRRRLGPAPTARFLHRAAGVQNDSGRWLYVFGGRGELSEFNDLWILDKLVAGGDALSSSASSPAASSPAAASSSVISPAGSAWRHVAADPAPPQRQSPTLTAVGTRLLMFGGRQGDTTFLNDTWVFDTLACAWTCVRASDNLPALPGVQQFGMWPNGGGSPVRPSPRWAHSAVAFGSSVLVFGGSAPGTCFNDLHWFDMEGEEPLTWRKQPVTVGPSPPARSGHCACALGEDQMFVFGGNTTETSFNDLWEYSVSDGIWAHVRASAGQSPSCRVGHTLTALGSRLLVLGGREYSTNHFDPSLHSFNVTSRQWREIPLEKAGGGATPVRTGHCATVHAGRMLLFGGLNDKNLLLDDLTSVSLIT